MSPPGCLDVARRLRAAAGGLHPALVLALVAGSAAAHKASDAYLRVDVDGPHILQRLDIALRDLDRELTLDANGDAAITWGEVRNRWHDIEALATAGVQLQPQGAGCRALPPPAPTGPQLDEHSDGRYAVLLRRWTCDTPVAAWQLDYRLFAASDPTHRGILLARQGDRAFSAVLEPGAAARRFGPAEGMSTDEARGHVLNFVAAGVHHILIGTDHLLFLLALLLPAVLLPGRRGRVSARAPADAPAARPAVDAPAVRWLALGLAHGAPARLDRPAVMPWPGAADAACMPWQPAGALGPVLRQVTQVVTAFTVAHSLTLALAVLDVVNPPSRWVEALIAGSVLLAALNNLVPLIDAGRWRFTFGFGLVHGFGFAAVMKDLGLADGALAGPLLAFNLGVELGQLAVVLLVVPLAWALRTRRIYVPMVLRGGSLLIALAAWVWLVERMGP